MIMAFHSPMDAVLFAVEAQVGLLGSAFTAYSTELHCPTLYALSVSSHHISQLAPT